MTVLVITHILHHCASPSLFLRKDWKLIRMDFGFGAKNGFSPQKRLKGNNEVLSSSSLAFEYVKVLCHEV